MYTRGLWDNEHKSQFIITLPKPCEVNQVHRVFSEWKSETIKSCRIPQMRDNERHFNEELRHSPAGTICSDANMQTKGLRRHQPQ